MSLIARLENAATQLPPSHFVDFARIPQLLGALLTYVEHGDDFLDAAEDAERGVHAFLTEVAEAENAELVAQRGDQPQPASGAVVAQPATPIGQAPVQPQSAPVGAGAMPPQLLEVLGGIMAELQSLSADRGDRQRTQISVSDPPSAPERPERPEGADQGEGAPSSSVSAGEQQRPPAAGETTPPAAPADTADPATPAPAPNMFGAPSTQGFPGAERT